MTNSDDWCTIDNGLQMSAENNVFDDLTMILMTSKAGELASLKVPTQNERLIQQNVDL